MGRRSHVKPILDIATILAERGYNVILLASGNNVLSSEYTILQKRKGLPN
ncbi:glycosyltransferase family 1 protein [Rhizophagus irregularis DAOM 181602=DAOM 197198]|nr:glycosyltransferase family 1 protein [Rhizophagus irregularis DAOM 181602=DAOM 197198]